MKWKEKERSKENEERDFRDSRTNSIHTHFSKLSSNKSLEIYLVNTCIL